MLDGGAIEAGGRERLVERGRDVGGAHRGTRTAFRAAGPPPARIRSA